MSPKKILKAKAMAWYWLNFHPSEISESPLSDHIEYGYVEGSDWDEPGMMVVAEKDYPIANFRGSTMFIYKDPIHWHEINKAITQWYGWLGEADKTIFFEYMKYMKGKPLSRWKHVHTGLGAPDWESLAECFLSRDLI